MDLELEGKTALVTGASRGIGLAIAQALHHEGVSLVLVAHTDETLQKAARSITRHGGAAKSNKPAPVHPIAANLNQQEEVARVARQAILRLGHIDILINNAAMRRTECRFFDLERRRHGRSLLLASVVKGIRGYVRVGARRCPSHDGTAERFYYQHRRKRGPYAVRGIYHWQHGQCCSY